jgi:hypothetical protein
VDVGDEQPALRPSPARPLRPDEPFVGLSATVGDFWSWAFSDLRSNIARGVLAEFLVARAVEAQQSMRVSWDNYDVEAPDGTRIEVKSSAYLQSWPQKRHSALIFGRLAARSWDPETDTYSEAAEVRADVFVFAVHTCRDPDAYDMLDVGQWEFWIVDADEVRTAGFKTVGIAWVRSHGNRAGHVRRSRRLDPVDAHAAVMTADDVQLDGRDNEKLVRGRRCEVPCRDAASLPTCGASTS